MQEVTSRLLTHLALGDSEKFAKTVAEILPNLSPSETARLGDFFSDVATFFYRYHLLNTDPRPYFNQPIRDES